MFILEDPSHRSTERQKHLRASQIRSYAAYQTHFRRTSRNRRFIEHKVTTESESDGTGSGKPDSLLSTSNKTHTFLLATKPSLELSGRNSNSSDNRAIRFFQERTAQEWSGWSDALFWTELVPRASHQFQALKHAMVSLSAYHEFVEQKQSFVGSKSRAIALTSANKALEQLNKDYGLMSIGAILMTHIVITRISSGMDDTARFKAEKMEFELFNNIQKMLNQKPSPISKDDLHLITHVLEPLVQRQGSRDGESVDAIYCLENTSASLLWPDGRELPTIPSLFESIAQAHHILEAILEYTAYLKKTDTTSPGILPQNCEVYLQKWKNSVDIYENVKRLTRQERSSLSLLKIAARFGVMIIMAMNARDETIFDEYTDLFEDFVDAFEESVKCKQQELKPNVNFGLSPGLLILAGNSAMRWCRDPRVRARLMDVQLNSQQCDGYQSSIVGAHIASYIQHVEESGIDPPPVTCKDIPATNRVILNAASFFATSMQIKLELIRDPWGACTVHEYWVPWVGMEGHPKQLNPTPRYKLEDEAPLAIMGRGYMSRLDRTTGKRFGFNNPRFFFPLPRS